MTVVIGLAIIAALLSAVGAVALGFAPEKRARTTAFGIVSLALVLSAAAIAIARTQTKAAAAEPEPSVERPDASEDRDREPSPPIEAERQASRDLLRIDRFVRGLYAALATPGLTSDWLRPRSTNDCRIDASGCAWWPSTLPQRILADELTVHSHVLGPIRFLERSRTVHVVSNLAFVVSVCCLSSRARGDRTVNVMQLERSGEGWILRDFVSREGIVPFSEKTADPR